MEARGGSLLREGGLRAGPDFGISWGFQRDPFGTQPRLFLGVGALVTQYTISPKGEKGRSFSAERLAAIRANGLYEDAHNSDNLRPVWAMFAGSDAELKAFMTNLRLGRRADSNKKRMEFLKSAGWQMGWQREEEGSLATIYHPDLFRLDPGMVDPDGIQFVMVLPNDWVQAQQVDPAGPAEHVLSLIPEGTSEKIIEVIMPLVTASYLFAAYLDRRTRCPLIADGRFYFQILVAALSTGLASLPLDDVDYWSGYRHQEWGRNPSHGFAASGLEDVGVQTAISFKASHENFETFLSEQVSLYFRVVS